MEDYSYWVSVYSIVFSILIASLSINSIFFIKDKTNKTLAFFVFTGLYSLILSYFFGSLSGKYMEQDYLPKFIFEGYRSHLFHGNIYLLFTLIILIALTMRILINKRK